MLSSLGACLTSRSNGACQESSVAKFGAAVHTKVMEGHNEDETSTRGASLRELQRFFKEHDKDEGYAGLRRIADEDGTAVWTILKETELAAQLERRANERREEERRHEKIFNAQARAQSEETEDLSQTVALTADANAAGAAKPVHATRRQALPRAAPVGSRAGASPEQGGGADVRETRRRFLPGLMLSGCGA